MKKGNEWPLALTPWDKMRRDCLACMAVCRGASLASLSQSQTTGMDGHCLRARAGLLLAARGKLPPGLVLPPLVAFHSRQIPGVGKAPASGLCVTVVCRT